jgi:ADP-ribose pyrophosphatase YjhB (NUDIX family)
MPLFPSNEVPPPTIRIRVGGVYVKDDCLLLVRHQKEGRSYWLLPGGGVESGETMPQALEREALEECGVVTRTKQLLFVSEAISASDGRHLVNMTFFGEILEGEPYLCEPDGRIVEVAYVDKAKLRDSFTLFPDFINPLLAVWDSGFSLPPQYLGNLWRN